MSAPAPRIPFRENIYGNVKRIRTFWEWMERFRREQGRDRLSVLDFGCGTGAELTVPLAHGGDRFLGVDAHAASIAQASASNVLPNLGFSRESTAELRARGARFDVVICSEVLEHTYEPRRYLEDFHALLCDPGVLIVSVPNGAGAFEKLQKLDAFLHRVGVGQALDGGSRLVRAAYRAAKRKSQAPESVAEPPQPGYLNFDSRHVQFFELGRLEELFREAGFEVRDRAGRVLLCGPYVDFWARVLSPLRFLFRLNNALADRLPLRWAADWMFCLERR